MPAPPGERAAAWLAGALEKVARAEILLGVATRLQNEPAAGADRQIQVDVRMLRLKKPGDEGRPLGEGEAAMPVLRGGDLFTFELANRSAYESADVSVLFGYSDYGIDVYYPSRFVVLANRLPPGGKVRVPAAKVGTRTVGVEHAVVFAVRSGALPVDFGAVAQAGVAEGQRAPAATTALEQLALLFRHSGERLGLKLTEVEQIQARVFTFRTAPPGAVRP